MVLMCPDRQIVSVYADGELPAPWKEKFEKHLSECGVCRARLETYRRISRILAHTGCEGGAVETAAEKVMERLSSRKVRTPPVWQRTVRVPLPAAAAAAILIVALSVVWLLPVKNSEPALAEIHLEMGDTVPIADMNGVLQYLGAGDGGDYVVLRLPERNFISAGEPTILKAADYSRGP
jgi:hypothetical protein